MTHETRDVRSAYSLSLVGARFAQRACTALRQGKSTMSVKISEEKAKHETGDVRQVIERLLAELRGSHLGGVSRERAIEIAEVLTKELVCAEAKVKALTSLAVTVRPTHWRPLPPAPGKEGE